MLHSEKNYKNFNFSIRLTEIKENANKILLFCLFFFISTVFVSFFTYWTKRNKLKSKRCKDHLQSVLLQLWKSFVFIILVLQWLFLGKTRSSLESGKNEVQNFILHRTKNKVCFLCNQTANMNLSLPAIGRTFFLIILYIFHK